jgi:hydroxyethylthiazole kinase
MSAMTHASAPTAVSVSVHLDAVRRRAPLVHCITNSVVTGFTANALLALGASPAMVDIPEEAGAFARVASGLLVNLGTPHREQRAAMLEAAAAASDAGVPWVLDPVAIGVLPVRTGLARELLALRPTIVRGNPSEVLALAGAAAGGRGTDATDRPEAALDAARSLADRHGCVVAISGEVDLVTDGARVASSATGTPLLTRVTGGGCALGAVVAAFAGASPATSSAFDASVAAVSAYTIAAERAEAAVAARATSGRGAADGPGAAGPGSTGPGSFAVALLDELAALDPDAVDALARIEVVA